MTIDAYPSVKVNARTARETSGAHCPPQPACAWFKDAGPFIVHGHRLASLYRGIMKPPNPFIVLKICNSFTFWLAKGYAYLWNDEAISVRAG
jgi:hypothetical protein